VSIRNRIAVALSSILVGLLLMGAAYDKPQWYLEALDVVGLVLFVGGPLWAVFRGRPL
jgi:hypothetical protein